MQQPTQDWSVKQTNKPKKDKKTKGPKDKRTKWHKDKNDKKTKRVPPRESLLCTTVDRSHRAAPGSEVFDSRRDTGLTQAWQRADWGYAGTHGAGREGSEYLWVFSRVQWVHWRVQGVHSVWAGCSTSPGTLCILCPCVGERVLTIYTRCLEIMRGL